jgi:hypothetical protein
MYLTSREAARVLAWPTEDGRCGLTRNQTMRLLATGIAGQALEAGGMKAYDHQVIDDLAGVEDVPRSVLDTVSPLICRLGPARSIDLTLDWEQQAGTVSLDWKIPLLTRVFMGICGPDREIHPLVMTVSHHVVFGADIMGWSYTRPPLWGHRPKTLPDGLPKEFGVDLQLAPPGPWFEEFRSHRVTLGPGNPWILWDHPRRQPWQRRRAA